MKISGRRVTSLFLLLVATAVSVPGDDKPLSETDKIEVLIKHIEELKGASFVRNNSDYDAKTAAKFLRSKWQSRRREVKTAMDFIDKVASVSSTTGKPYLIRFKDRSELKSAEYLKSELKKLEQRRKEPDKP